MPFIQIVFRAAVVTMLLGVLSACMYEDVSLQLDEMRAELRDIAAAAGTPPLGEMTTFAKPSASSVSFRFGGGGSKFRRDDVIAAAMKHGYRLPETIDGDTTLCSTKSRYRTLLIGAPKDGQIEIRVRAGHPNLIGKPRCWKGFA